VLTGWFGLVEHPPVTGAETELVLVLSCICFEFMLKVEFTIFLLCVFHLYRLPLGLTHGTGDEDGRLQTRMAVVDLVFLCHGGGCACV
jgi:hypothetical protein